MTDKKHFKTTLENILNIIPEGYSESALEKICFKLIEKALQGDSKSINFIRDTIGQAPFKEMILNEYATNPAIDKLDSILSGIREQAESIVIIDDISESEESILMKKYFEISIEKFGIEKIKQFTYEGKSLTSLEDLARQLMNDEGETL